MEYGTQPDTHLMTDAWTSFAAIGESFAAHHTARHSDRAYVRGIVHVNSAEGFNSRVRRTIAGVFHHISPRMLICISTKSGFGGRNVLLIDK